MDILSRLGRLIVLVPLIGSTATATDLATLPEPTNRIAVVAMPGVSRSIENRVVSALRMYCRATTALHEAPQTITNDMDRLTASLGALFIPSDKIRVVLFDSSGLPVKARNALGVAKDFIGIDIAVSTNNLSKADAQEVFMRRIEKVVMKQIGLRYRLKDCPNPTCVMFRHRSLAEMDVKGRNFCPPCMQLFEEAIKQEGILPPKTTLHRKASTPKDLQQVPLL